MFTFIQITIKHVHIYTDNYQTCSHSYRQLSDMFAFLQTTIRHVRIRKDRRIYCCPGDNRYNCAPTGTRTEHINKAINFYEHQFIISFCLTNIAMVDLNSFLMYNNHGTYHKRSLGENFQQCRDRVLERNACWYRYMHCPGQYMACCIVHVTLNNNINIEI